jgi:hypothetical protein
VVARAERQLAVEHELHARAGEGLLSSASDPAGGWSLADPPKSLA